MKVSHYFKREPDILFYSQVWKQTWFLEHESNATAASHFEDGIIRIMESYVSGKVIGRGVGQNPTD
jgi:hypothetical protein